MKLDTAIKKMEMDQSSCNQPVKLQSVTFFYMIDDCFENIFMDQSKYFIIF